MLQLLPVLLISLASLAGEVFLTRYFAIASWEEYGYWVISMVMTGYSFSGVVLSLFKPFFLRHVRPLTFILPLGIAVAATAGFQLAVRNPFNPLELQNPDLWLNQLGNIGKYYLALFPYFFLSGTFIGLNFMAGRVRIRQLYAADLVGAGLGSLFILGMMLLLHPFHLLWVILPFIGVAAWLAVPTGNYRRWCQVGVVVLCLGCEGWLMLDQQAHFCEYKAIYPVLHVQGNQVRQEITSPRGYYLALENFTERRDIDLSNNYSSLGVSGPPEAIGWYKDGNRVTALPKEAPAQLDYATAALDSLPYLLRPAAPTLLIGTSGGFRLWEVPHLGAKSIVALESDPLLLEQFATRFLLKRLPPIEGQFGLESPQAYLRTSRQKFGVIDVAGDYLAGGYANKYAFTREAIEAYWKALRPDGILSLPVSIQELPIYAVKLTVTARAALEDLGVDRPAEHVMVYRSAWNARVLISPQAWSNEDLRQVQKFCSDRSFDLSYFPGAEPPEETIWNDLPPVSFENEQAVSPSGGEAQDALRADVAAMWALPLGDFLAGQFFQLRPPIQDRPFFYSVLRLAKFKDVWRNLQLVPQQEIGYFVNWAVLLQAVAFAILVVVIPLLARNPAGLRGNRLWRGILYFSSLGLGFLFIEITLIEKFTWFLNDYTSAFALVITCMLIFSGLGSFYSDHWGSSSWRVVRNSLLVVGLLLLLNILFLNLVIEAAMGWPIMLKWLLIFVLVAPLALAMGMPFPTGLAALRGHRSNFLPWAWGINGAFSVIATPLATILAMTFGYQLVFGLALVCYMLVFWSCSALMRRE